MDDRRRPDGPGWVVLADPEGNEFCILRSEAEIAASPPPDHGPRGVSGPAVHGNVLSRW